MISIIVCSINPILLYQLSKNIKQTIGVDYEIIAFDNTLKNWGICKVYNYSAEKAKYDNLVFCHEDILFHINNWGQKLLNHLSDKKIGLVGIAGGTYKSKYNSSWWTSSPYDYLQRKNILQKINSESVLDFCNPYNENISEVVAIDGVFMACRKEVWLNNKFDEIDFPKFHFYDLDFSFQILQKSKVIVVYDILIEHLSYGSYNKEWLSAAEIFTTKWKKILPVTTVELSKKKQKILEKNSRIFYIHLLINNDLKLKSIKTYLLLFLKHPFSLNHKNFISRIIRLFL
jgi:hypothetical protein